MRLATRVASFNKWHRAMMNGKTSTTSIIESVAAVGRPRDANILRLPLRRIRSPATWQRSAYSWPPLSSGAVFRRREPICLLNAL